MHELSIALSLLDAVEEQSRQRGGARITAVHLKIGPLSGVVPQALRSAFEMAREESDFPDCQVQIEETPVLIRCPKCLTERGVASIQNISCVVCGTATSDVIAGRELEVCAMEIIE
jgi:hydrogenase nickel incorporation protein HypA/HybF